MTASPDDPIEIARRRVAKVLKGFSAEFPDTADPWTMASHRPDRKTFPVPELVLFLLGSLMRWRVWGPGEKTRWTVMGSIQGEPVAFELRKFGFTILRNADATTSIDRIVGQLNQALKEVEALLEPYAAEQVDRGAVLIVNRSGEFGDRYRFFRDRARKAYARADTPPRKPVQADDAGFAGLTRHMNHRLKAMRQGFFYSTAMVDAYFSALEHRLILLRAFTGRPLEPGELLTFLGAGWDDKLKVVALIDTVPEGAQLLGRMRRLKARVRNPFAHGGVENDKGSLFVHMPNLGALPANFSRFGDSVRFSFMPMEADDHAEACALFDALDAFLKSGHLEGPATLMDSGVDPSFDPKTLSDYAAAIAGGEAALERFIGRWHHRWERHANMDY